MKTLLLLLSLPLAASAQKLVATSSPRTFYVGKEKAPLYRYPADTAGKPNTHLYPAAEVMIVGDYSPRWAIVKNAGYLYLVPTEKLSNYRPLGGAAGLLADGSSMPVDATTHRITYEGVVEVPGVTKEQLYSRALEWVAKAYNSAQDVIQMQDKESGKLVMKGLTKVSIRSYAGGVVRHTFSIYVKDGRYKYIITNFEHDASVAPNIHSGGPLESEDGKIYALGGGKKAWQDIKQQTNQEMTRIVAGLQTAMTLKGAKDPSDF